MAAATTSATQGATDVLTSKIEAALRNIGDEGLATVKGAAIPFSFTDRFTITTAMIDDVGDIRRLYKLPTGFYITEFRGEISDVDTNGTPLLSYDVVTTDSADVVKNTIVSASTKGRTGGTDRIRDAAVGQFCGDQFLAIKVTAAAATAAAGTYDVWLSGTIGAIVLASDDPLTTDAGT